MLRVLTVDDYESRHERIVREMTRAGVRAEFRHRYGPARVTDDDIAWAQLVWLDHDMCQRCYTAAGIVIVPDEGAPCPAPVERGTNALDLHCGCLTGMDLVRRMVALPHRPTVFVHTANPAAGPEMVRSLTDGRFRVGYMPASRWGWYDWRTVMRNAGVLG